MHAHKKLLILVILVGFASVGIARGAAAPTAKKPDTTAAVPTFPYAAEITEDEVPVRSGPGTNYYICGKLKKTDKVNVVGSQFSWSRIVPPPGSFSWISMRYISIDPDDSTVGIVTADGIRVYAGSEFKEPIHSETLQLKLKRSDEVKLMGKQVGDYYKIAPPTGAYLWVSTQYLKPIAPPVVKVTPPPVKPPPVKPKVDTKPKTDPNTKTVTKTIVPTMVSGESENLKLYRDLEKQVKAEQEKPAEKQNYDNIKKALAVIAGNKDAGKAARYAEATIKQIKGFELALVIGKEVKLQNEQLKQTKDGIDKARATRVAQVNPLGKFAVIGKLQTSNILNYRITDDNNKTVCYAIPTGAALKMDYSKLVDSRVGLVGTIEPHPQTSGALVRFTEIVELN